MLATCIMRSSIKSSPVMCLVDSFILLIWTLACLQGIVWHFADYVYSLSGGELEKRIDTTLMSVLKYEAMQRAASQLSSVQRLETGGHGEPDCLRVTTSPCQHLFTSERLKCKMTVCFLNYGLCAGLFLGYEQLSGNGYTFQGITAPSQELS